MSQEHKAATTPNEQHGARLFGRRVSHPLSSRQQRLWQELLPAVSMDLEGQQLLQPSRAFAYQMRETWLEIGFGSGEHLVWQAEGNPSTGIIGCEPFVNGVAKLLSEISERKLQNVRIYTGDARRLVAQLGDRTIARTFILFPDPWPKKRHHKRRLISRSFVLDLARVMVPGGQLRFATDIADYARSALLAVTQGREFTWCARGARDWRERPDDWPQTRYGRKAISAGRRCGYFCFERTIDDAQ